MLKEIFWKKALEKTLISIEKGSLFPLETIDITNKIYNKDDFIIRKLDTTKFKKLNIFGPKQNPFQPWDKILEIEKIGRNHQLILNKYPVQKGHILLITNKWKPQNGWLDIKDWSAIKIVNEDTTGLWFFNSSPLAGASQPHRHFQLLRRSINEKKCPREEWFIKQKQFENKEYLKKIIVRKFDFKNSSKNNFNIYLEISKELGLGEPSKNSKPKFPYNILITNDWIAMIKRSNDDLYGYSINGLGFAGYILVTKNSDISFLKRYGPEKLLENFI